MRLSKLRPLAILLGVLLASIHGEAAKKPKTHKLDKALASHVSTGGDEPLNVIVSTRPDRRAELAGELLQGGKRLRGDLEMIGALAIDLSADEIAALADRDEIESISLDAPVFSTAAPHGVPDYSHMLALRTTLGLDSTWRTGAAVTVAVIDSGIQAGADFGPRIVRFFTVRNGTIKRAGPTDTYGHGSHVAGLIGASGEGSQYQYPGVAPGVRLIGLKVLGDDGSGRTSDVIAALQYATANKAALGIDVINLSMGHPILEPAATDPLVRAVEAAVRAGIVVVTSAGNYGLKLDGSGAPGYAGLTSPGNAPSAITVGAVDAWQTTTHLDDAVASYSSRGPTWYDAMAKPDLVAPGTGLVSTPASCVLATKHPHLKVRSSSGRQYMRLTGTSMAAAITSGAVALVLEASRQANPRGPALTPNAVKAILQYTAVPLRDPTGAEYDALTQGAGSLNVGGAIALASAIRTAAPSGTAWLSGGVDPSTTFGADRLLWSRFFIWDQKIAWGDPILLNDAAWRTNIVWGDSTVWANGRNIVWGDNVVWANGRNIVWGGNIVWGDNTIGMTDAQGRNIVWGYVGAQGRNIVWGDLAPILGLPSGTSTVLGASK